MFDEKAIESYKQVVAPPELKKRVMKSYHTGQTKSNNIRLYKSLSLVAACLVLVFAASVFTGRDGRISVSLNGTQLSATPIAISTRMAEDAGIMAASFGRTTQPQISIPLTVEVSSESEITVSEGEMQVFDATTNKLLYAGNVYTAEGCVSITWHVEPGEQTTDSAPYMTITAKVNSQILQLKYEEADDIWMIYQKK